MRTVTPPGLVSKNIEWPNQVRVAELSPAVGTGLAVAAGDGVAVAAGLGDGSSSPPLQAASNGRARRRIEVRARERFMTHHSLPVKSLLP